MASPAFATAWDEANRAAHQQMVNVLSGQQGGAVTAKNGQVSINLGPFVDKVKQRLVADGFSVAANIPTVNTSFTVFESQGVTRAQGAYRLLNTLGTWLPILALVLLAIGVYVAKSHRRALLAAGLGVAGGMLLLGVTLAVVRPLYLNAVPPQVPHDAAATIYDTLLRFLRVSLRAVLVAGLVVAAAAFLTGGSVTAVRTRQGLTHGIGWLRGGAESAGLRTGRRGHLGVRPQEAPAGARRGRRGARPDVLDRSRPRASSCSWPCWPCSAWPSWSSSGGRPVPRSPALPPRRPAPPDTRDRRPRPWERRPQVAVLILRGSRRPAPPHGC